MKCRVHSLYTFRGLARCYRTQIETTTGIQLSAISLAIPFPVRYAGFVLSRFTVRPDGRTPFQYLLGTPYRSLFCMFGESVFALIPEHEVRAAKLSNRWVSGCWRKRDASSYERLVGTKLGLLKQISSQKTSWSAVEPTGNDRDSKDEMTFWCGNGLWNIWTACGFTSRWRDANSDAQEEIPTILHLHLRQTVTCPKCQDTESELLHNRHARLPVWGIQTLANAKHIKMLGTRAAEPGPRGSRRRRLSTDVMFSKTKLCGDEQRNGGVVCDMLDCGRTITLENDYGNFRIQCQHHPFLRLSGCAKHCAESWAGESQSTGSENAMVSRRCSREKATNKSNRMLRKQTTLTWERKYCRWPSWMRCGERVVWECAAEKCRGCFKGENELYPDWFFWNATRLILETWDRGGIAVVWSLGSAGYADVDCDTVTLVVSRDGFCWVSNPNFFGSLDANQAKNTCERCCQAWSHEC